MNGKIFGNSLVKFGFVAFALALGLVACGDGGSTNGPSNNHEGANVSSVESEENLPSCTESREGFVNFINGTKEGFVCKDRKWVHYDMIADIDDNLPGCTGSREGLTAYLYEENRELNCVEGSWDVVGEVANSSSSVILSDSEGSSSSSAKSSSSVASSSSVTSSSSVASSSSTSAPNSSSSVIPGTDPGSSSSVVSSSSSSVPGSSSSVIPGIDPGSSSSSAKSSSSVASSSSMKAAWAYLNPDIDYGEFTDERDGQVYKTVKIGTQTWMAQNLNYAYTGVAFDNGYYTSDSTSWCFENKASNCDKYGRLYTWSAVMDSAAQFNVNAGTKCGYRKTCTPNSPHRGICPEGWHVPTNEEYRTLYTYIGGSSTAGSLLKSTSGWNDYNGKSGNGTDKYGFSVLPAGGYGGVFGGVGYYAYLWSASEYNSDYAEYRFFYYEDVPVYGNYRSKSIGQSLRCLKDSRSVTSSSSVASSSSMKAAWAYLNPDIDYGEFADERDGQVYKTVKIGTQTWMAENLNYAYTGVKYNFISYTSDSTSWCYENKASNCDKYGRLYTWSAVMDSAAQFNVNAGTKCGFGKTCTPNSPHRGICPEGWHVPTNEEYSTLYTYIGGSRTAGTLLKSTSGWNDYDGKSGNGADEYGFSVLPAGNRSYYGDFSIEGYRADLWSASENDSSSAWYQDFYFYYINANQYDAYKSNGRSLRCLKD